MSRRIGFFEDFKGGDTVLVSLTGSEANVLANELETFAASSEQSLVIRGEEIPGHRVELVAVRACGSSNGSGFRWPCGPSEVGAAADKLRALGRGGPGHHYFELCASEVQLMVSVGEYAY
jgi:hypothetical protein